MACFVAALTDHRPLDRTSLLSLADVPPFDAASAAFWHDGRAGICAVPLRAAGRPHGGGHAAFADDLAVVVDGRLDDRQDLARRLGPQVDAARSSDADLVRAAYLRWGDELAQHLLGDFALCVWDARARRLVCARDRFGVKPLYYAWQAQTLLVSNVLAALRRSPLVSSRLSARAVGDLLVFGDPQDDTDTMLADVHRVPPAGRLTARPGASPRLSRYWRFEEPRPLRYATPGEYVEQYRELLGRAVRDRLPEGGAGLLMSGGLDSCSVSALARAHAPAGTAGDLRAFTAVYERLIADPERELSTTAARALGLPIEHLAVDGYELFERWSGDALPVVPIAEPLTAITHDLLARVGRHATVAITGDGGDPFLLPATVPRHVGRVPLANLARDLWWSVWRCGQMPLLGLRSTLRRWIAPPEAPPEWLAAPLRAEYDVEQRWHAVRDARYHARDLRGESMADIRAPWWASSFESLDPGATRQPVELRYPFFDLRLVSFSLALPSYPWCVDKRILREAMRGRLPDAIRLRPKTPLAGDPVRMRRRWTMADAMRALAAAPDIDRFVDRARFESTVRPDRLLLDGEPGTIAAMSLALWLTHSAGSPSGLDGA